MLTYKCPSGHFVIWRKNMDYYNIILFTLALVITVIMLRKNINTGIIMLIDTLFIIFSVKMPFDKIISNIIKSLISSKTIGIILVLILIMMIENIMRKTGMIKSLVENISYFFTSKKVISFVLPAVIGLLPSPGGARFSCPMVEEVLQGSAKGEDKAFINYWFRHVWMDAFILYPGIVITSEILSINVISLFVHMIPFMILYSAIGVFIFRKVNFDNDNAIINDNSKRSIKHLFKAAYPIIFIICIYIILISIPNINFELQIAALCTIILLIITKGYSYLQVKNSFIESFKIKYIIIIIGVMIFNTFLSESGLVNEWINTLTLYNIPKEILFIIIPYIAGLSSGIALGFASIAFPLLLQMGITDNIWHVAAAFAAGFMGVMPSPLHLCAVMSSDYFKIELRQILKKSFLGSIIILVSVIIVILI